LQLIKPEWHLKARLLISRLLIKFGKLRHIDYTATELSDMANQYVPKTFSLESPIGNGELTLLEVQVKMPYQHNVLKVELLSSIIIGALTRPIYRAHVMIVMQAHPRYDTETNTVMISELNVKDVKLVNDEYMLIEDSRDILSLVFPKQLQNLVSGTVKTALGIMTGGGSDKVKDYLNLYLKGSKQSILAYHRPEIEGLVEQYAHQDKLQYQLKNAPFEEYLFCLYGKAVVVEDGVLRFKF